MNWTILFAAQAGLAGVALYAGTLWPSTGGEVLLVPLGSQDRSELWQWVSAEDVAVVRVDAGSVTVRVSSQPSLWRVIGKGYLPVRAKGSGCLSPQAASEGSNSIS